MNYLWCSGILTFTQRIKAEKENNAYSSLQVSLQNYVPMHCMGVTFEVVQGIVCVSPSKIPLPDMTQISLKAGKFTKRENAFVP